MLPAFTCGQYGDCDPYDGQCKCPPGWSGIDCLTPRKLSLSVGFISHSLQRCAFLCLECGSLADDQRIPREDGQKCDCKDGWGGINCNGSLYPLHSKVVILTFYWGTVCKTDQACRGFPLFGIPDSEQDGSEAQNMTCYTGGETVFQNHQMCDVTSALPVFSFNPHCLSSYLS